MRILKIKKLKETAIIPAYAKPGDSGFDLCAAEDITIYALVNSSTPRMVKTGLAFEIPEGFEMQVRQRSGLSVQYPNYIANAPGTVDSGYRGEIMVAIVNRTGRNWEIKAGDRIAQGIIQKVEHVIIKETDELSETDRGSGGFGHTGVK